MGDWRLGPAGKWIYDKDAPSPDPSVTTIRPLEQVPTFTDPRQDDLSAQDERHGKLVNTAKVGRLDRFLLQPPQDPAWRPDGAA